MTLFSTRRISFSLDQRWFILGLFMSLFIGLVCSIVFRSVIKNDTHRISHLLIESAIMANESRVINGINPNCVIVNKMT